MADPNLTLVDLPMRECCAKLQMELEIIYRLYSSPTRQLYYGSMFNMLIEAGTTIYRMRQIVEDEHLTQTWVEEEKNKEAAHDPF